MRTCLPMLFFLCLAAGCGSGEEAVHDAIQEDQVVNDIVLDEASDPDAWPDTVPDTPLDVPDAVEADTPADLADTGPDPCAPIEGASYATLPINGPPTDRPAAEHPDINIKLRGWAPADASEPRDFVDYGGDTDPMAPKLYTIYEDNEFPGFGDLHVVGCWDGIDACTEGGYPVHLAGLLADPGQIIEAPFSGYDIGDGYTAMVLYADEDSITLKYTREDNVVSGYTIHMVGICVEPSLLALYEEYNAEGRGRLPVLRGNQALGRSLGDQVLTAVRDTGAFMDPRSEKDWW
jgi:hypothetical protein